MLPHFADAGVDAVCEGEDDFFTLRVIVFPFLLEVSAEAEEAGADVALQFLGPKDFSGRSCGLAPPGFKLEEPVFCGAVSLCEEQVVLVFCIDMVDAPFIAEHFYRGFQARELECMVFLCGEEGMQEQA